MKLFSHWLGILFTMVLMIMLWPSLTSAGPPKADYGNGANFVFVFDAPPASISEPDNAATTSDSPVHGPRLEFWLIASTGQEVTREKVIPPVPTIQETRNGLAPPYIYNRHLLVAQTTAATGRCSAYTMMPSFASPGVMAKRPAAQAAAIYHGPLVICDRSCGSVIC